MREEQQHKDIRLEPMSRGQQPEQFKTTNEGNESSEQSKPSKKGESQSKASKSGDEKKTEQSNAVKEGKESPEQDKTSKMGNSNLTPVRVDQGQQPAEQFKTKGTI